MIQEATGSQGRVWRMEVVCEDKGQLGFWMSLQMSWAGADKPDRMCEL